MLAGSTSSPLKAKDPDSLRRKWPSSGEFYAEDLFPPEADPDEVEEQPAAQSAKVPFEPSVAERDQHNLTHTPPAPWCEVCVSGQGREDPHKRLDMD